MHMIKRGFGTNFHSVYAGNPQLYHEFSSAESFSNTLQMRLETLVRPGVLLDVACGTGHKTNLLSRHFSQVYALDISKPLLAKAREMYAGNPKMHYLWASAAQIPLLDDSVDTALVTWGSFPLTKTIREIQRVLKPGGVAIRIGASGLDDFTTMFPKFDPSRIVRINKTFQKYGFVIEEHEVNLRFKSIESAKDILAAILGLPGHAITTKSIVHRVVLCYCVKHDHV